ncbi:MAG: type II toxin-antitoxin system mRNA interferase toxin, RelE/StbE family [Patescibacteria group bacterium]
MEVLLHPSFIKDFKKCEKNVRAKFVERKQVFILNPFHPLLNNHQLHGKWAGHRSINITGDYRAIFYTKGDSIVFIRIGTHPQLYK